MRSRGTRIHLFRAVALVGCVALALVAAGASGAASRSSGARAASADKSFPLLKVVWEAPDYFDPALAYTVESWSILWNVYDGLLSYKHAQGGAGATLIPALAKSLPKVSSGGKDYKFTLRPNMQYSNGQPVKASDFACTIERDYEMESPGVGFFSSIKGADEFGKLKPTKMRKSSIPGIVTNDAKGTIEIKLSHPEGDMLNILATLFTSFVPCGTPAKDMSTHPTPATGPYMIQSYTPHKSFTVVRNPHFSSIPNIPKGNPDKVVATITDDNARAASLVASNQDDYDFLSIPTDRLASFTKKYANRIKIYTPANTYYLWLNERYAPFNKLKARQAIEYAVDRSQFVQIFGGLAQPTQNFLPPTYKGVGYKKINHYHHNLAKAKQLVKASGTLGDAVTVWTNSSDPAKSLMTYMQSVLNSIGYKATLKVLDPQVYFQTIENQSTKAQTGYVDWYQDYPNPIDWLDVLLNGDRITQTHNNDVGNVDFADVNKKIEKLKAETKQPKALASQWAALDRELVVKYAAVVPYVNRSGTDFFSDKIDLSGGCYLNHVLYQWDFSSICMK